MVKDAEAMPRRTSPRRDLIDARNQADALAYSVEKTLNEIPRMAPEVPT